jgi:putative hemolysin
LTEGNKKEVVISRIDEKQCKICELPKGKGEQGEVCACLIIEENKFLVRRM